MIRRIIHARMERTANNPRGILRDRALIFATALLTRGVIGWIFFGSVDLTNSMLNTGRLLNGLQPSRVLVPYFHGIHHFLIWTAGVLSTHTGLPLGFSYKIVPILCEAVLAVAVFDAVMPERRRARIAGFLYALAPVGVWITSIHAQWDSISFAFMTVALVLAAKRSMSASVLAGAAFVLSALVKPMCIPFLPLLFPAPWRLFRGEDARENRRRAVAVMAGLAGTTVIYLAWVHAIGDPLRPKLIADILGYADRGVVLFGVPHLFGGRASRLLSLTPLLILVPLYWKGLLSRYEVVLLALAAIVATTGLSPQYLMWLVPFLLICGRDRYSAIYTLLAGIFLVLFYHNPTIHQNNYENLGAYAPLRAFSWLAPPVNYVEAKALLIVLIGNFLLPVSALMFFLVELFRVGRREPSPEIESPVHVPQIVAPAVLAIVIAVGSGLAAMAMPNVSLPEFSVTVHRKTAEYEMYRYRGPGLIHPLEPSWIIPAFRHEVQASPANIVSIGYLWTLAWAAAAWLTAPRVRTAATTRLSPLLATAVIGTAVIGSTAAAGFVVQLVRTPIAGEIQALHEGWLLSQGAHFYRDFFSNHSPFLAQFLALLLPDMRTELFPLLDLSTYISMARAVMALLALTAVGAAAWMAWRLTRWPGAPAVVAAIALASLTRLGDISDDVPALALFWIGAALLAGQWTATRRAATLAGAGMGLMVVSCLWVPQWLTVPAVAIYLVRLWTFKRTTVYALLATLSISSLAVLAINSAATWTDYVHFTIDYNRRTGNDGSGAIWLFVIAVVAGIVAGLAMRRVPERHRDRAGIALISLTAAAFLMASLDRLKPLSEADHYYATASHMQRSMRPADTVWVSAAQHPIAAADAHYYWFGFDEHLLWVLEAQKRGELPPYLPPVDEASLPPCAVARGLDPHVRFITAGGDLAPLPLARRCLEALLQREKALLPAPPYSGFAKIER